MRKRALEILAPAGSLESLKAAVCAGADAVYMGGSRFGARAYADNPEGELLLEAIDHAHLYGVKLYLTVNTLLKERELKEELYDYLRPCVERGVDAVIVQDLGVLRAIRSWFPQLDVHASTQMSLCGAGGVEFLKREGVTRAVLARELSLPEIQRIREETGMELECFVHGALCYCYSGQCLFSSFLGGRSGNRGRCAQPCRLNYEAVKAGGEPSGSGASALLSPKDLCALDLLPKIAEAGVYSLKIEGRMKRPEYTAGVVRIYRKYADLYLRQGSAGYRVDEKDRRELLLLFNRDGFSSGYYERHNGREMMALRRAEPSDREKKAYEELIRDLRGRYVEQERPIEISGEIVLRADEPMKLSLRERRTGVEASVEGDCPQQAENRPMETGQVEKQMRKLGGTPYRWESLDIRVEGRLFVPVQALNSLRREGLAALREELLRSAGAAPEHGEPSSGGLPEKRMETEAAGADRIFETRTPGALRELHISVETGEQLDAVLASADRLRSGEGKLPPLTAVYLEAGCLEERIPDLTERIRQTGLKTFVLLPPVFRSRTAGRYADREEFWKKAGADGYVIRNLEEYEFLRTAGWGGTWILDHNVYTFNSASRRLWRERGIHMQTSPLELNERELKELSSSDSIQIVYGRCPMMISAGCVQRTLGRCRRQPGKTALRDRFRKEFPVKNICRDCYNVIYNSQPTYLLDRMDRVGALGAGACRIMFTTENKDETRAVLADALGERRLAREFTRGHFTRGVE
ncbi:MAG: U32 family peptidase [Eubacteriales bacterium]|nr:U32 family peptidase [Eubacteriales bacterium]